MSILYNCKHAGQEYRITKFDNAMNVESTYLCSPSACQCPAFEKRNKCRHIEMLPQFISRNHIGDEWFLDFDRGGWVQMGEEWAQAKEMTNTDTVAYSQAEAELDRAMGADANDQQRLLDGLSPLPKGVTMMILDDSLAVHNAIAKAVGEPEAVIPERPKGVFIRRRL